MEKRCLKCNENLGDVHPNLKYCKECRIKVSYEIRKRYFLNNPIRFKKSQERYRKENRQKERDRKKDYYKRNIKEETKRREEYCKGYPERRRASWLSNRIKMPAGQLCVRCNKEFATQRHHKNYSKPLKIMFVCKPCHHQLDKLRRDREITCQLKT